MGRGPMEDRCSLLLCAFSSTANTCILCMQDIIGLDSDARMNTPSTVGSNWKWRADESQLTDRQFAFLGRYTSLYGRARTADSL